MNHIYRSIWSESLATWIAVPENTASKGKRSSVRNAVLATGLAVCCSASWALPTGQQVVSGQVSVASPSATQMNINQSSQNAIVNWNAFSIAPNEAVNILQPNASAMLLNRVVGIDASIIQGQLSANGQVFLINPNGILFSNTAQVDVGGLIASTHNISNADFLNGNFHFTQDGATGAVSNQGYIKTPAGGVVALIGAQVSNSGTIATPQGTTALAAGKTVDLDFKGNGLLEVNVPEAALNAQVDNKGAILADGGLVVLTAKAAGDLVSTVLGTEGLIQARSLTSRNGEIILDGGSNGVTQVSGTLDVSGANAGGKISVSGKDVNINSSANLNAQATNSGMAGTINVLGDMTNGTLNVAGKLDASASGTANGGFIETSAAHVKVADTAKVSTLAANGNSGTWLIDPVDFTIGVDMTGAAVSSALLGGNFTVQSTTGNVNVNDTVNWSANRLTLDALNDININSIGSLNVSGTGSLTLNATGINVYSSLNAYSTTVNASGTFNLISGTWNQINTSLPSFSASNFTITGGTFIRALSGDGVNSPYQLTDVYGLQGIGSVGMIGKSYTLANKIDANGTATWNNGAGFKPINGFTGTFDGLGRTISGLTIYRPSDNRVGLFGRISSNALIQNVGLIGAKIEGADYVGGLVGGSYGGNIINSYTTGEVTGSNYVGGLVGGTFCSEGCGYINISNSYATAKVSGSDYVGGLVGYIDRGKISNSYATGNVSGSSNIGGLVGSNNGKINDAYATGDVDGSYNIGGLVGYNGLRGSIDRTYATGRVTGSNYVGGLVGEDYSSSITNSFWDIQTTGQINGFGYGSSPSVTGKTTAEMMQMATFSNAGWSISNTGGSSAIWRIYEGSTDPLLRYWLRPLTVYFDGTNTYSNGDPNHLFGAGLGLFSDQQGYDISFVTIPSVGSQITSIQSIVPPNPPPNPGTDSTQPIRDLTEDFHNAPSSPGLPCNSASKDCNKRATIEPVLKVKNTAGRVERLQMSANKHYVSLLMEDGSVRVWDFRRGLERQMVTGNKRLALTDISAVDDKGEFLSISNRNGIVAQDIISALIDERFGLRMDDISSFASSADGRLLLISTKSGEIILWQNRSNSHSSGQSNTNNSAPETEENEEVSDSRAPVNKLIPAETEQNKKQAGIPESTNVFTPTNNGQNQKLWKISYQRGAVNSLTMTKDKRYAAILSRQPGVYGLAASESKFKPVIDAIDIIDLASGKVVKSLPNQGEYIIYMEFKDNDTLQIGLASGEVIDWSIATGEQKMVANFAEHVVAVDTDAAHDTFAFVLTDGTVRVGDNQNNIHLSIQNKENPFKYAKLLADGKKVLTVLASGDLSLWDVETGRKIARLFSMQNGWTVMDAFGRFDGSEDAIENFSWLANEDDIPLDKFSENYYEPGLLISLLQNQDYIHDDPSMVQGGITLPPKLNLQLAAQQTKADTVELQLDVYDRGGGIDKISVYHNGKLLSNDNAVVTQENAADHRVLKINVTPNSGKNTVKVMATNDIGIESSSSELSFDGKTKAYSPSLRLLTVGINQYSDPHLNLSYSVADANAIAQTIKSNSKVAASVHLLNEKATKPRILAELRELSRGAQHDELVIYLAGHGIAVGKEWYFLPYETRIQPTVEQIAATGITATELGNIFKDSKIQHILLMVDACYSGASTDAFDKFKNGQQHFTRQLSRSLGITVITATTKNQEAAELQSLGHGLFTYLMTKEMENKSASNSVTAHGVAASIVKTLPAFSQKMLGLSQEPAVYTFGSDFMLIDPSKKAGKNKTAGNK